MEIKERETNLEYLRIICMIMIVAGHSITHSVHADIPRSFNGMIAIILTQGARIEVNIFVMITGYFSVGKTVHWIKIRRQYLQIWIYSVFITGIVFALGEVSLGFKTVISVLVPVSSSQYWFATCYILLLLINPCLQICIEKLSEKQLRTILITFGIFWCIMPTLLVGAPGYSEFGWLAYIYLLAAYIRIYPLSIMSKIKIWHGIIIFLSICTLAIGTYFYGYSSMFLRNNAIYLYAEMNRIPAVVCAVILFLGFKNWNCKYSEFVNKVAMCTFGVYLFHDNPQIRECLWINILKVEKSLSSPLFVPYIMLCIAGIFAVGIVLEWYRQYLETTINNLCRKK